MSNWYGNSEKDMLLIEMIEFLKDHPVSELIEMVSVAVEEKEQQ